MGRRKSSHSHSPCAQAYRHRYGRAAYGFVVAAIASARLQAITISEIHYESPGRAGPRVRGDPHHSATVSDVSGWSFMEGIQFTFPPGSFIPGRGYVMVCADEAAFRAANPGVVPAGVFAGRLESTGESLVLSNRGGGVVAASGISDRGKWPSEPAGTGHTLSLRRPHLTPSEPESWAPSIRAGRDARPPELPGLGSRSDGDRSGARDLAVPEGHGRVLAAGLAWSQRTFDASTWNEGTAGIGYADGDDSTDISDMQGCRRSAGVPIDRHAAHLLDLGRSHMAMDGLVLGVNYDDGFIAYLNGVEVARASMPGTPASPCRWHACRGARGGARGALRDLEGPPHRRRQRPGAPGPQHGSHELRFLPPPSPARTEDPARRGEDHRLQRALRAHVRLALDRADDDGTGGSRPRGVSAHGRARPLRGLQVSGGKRSHGRRVPGRDRGFIGARPLDAGGEALPLEPEGDAVVAPRSSRTCPNDSRPASRDGTSDARFPDGDGEFAFAAEPDAGASRTRSTWTDIVLNEIFYNPPLGYTAGEFLELYNRGPDPVDLSGWAFTRGMISSSRRSRSRIRRVPRHRLGSDGPRGPIRHFRLLGPWTGVLCQWRRG